MHNFEKLYIYDYDYGLKYDYYSIMHYSAYAASRSRSRTTMLANGDPGFSFGIGARETLSNLDIVKLNTVYACQTSKL